MKTTTRLAFTIVLVSALNSQAAPLKDSVPLACNLMFFLTSTNNARFVPTNQFASDELIVRGIAVNSLDLSGGKPVDMDFVRSNMMFFFYALPFDQTYDFKLFDDHLKEVSKTEHGRSNSRLPTPVKDPGDTDRFKLQAAAGADFRVMFRPDQMFVITNKGVYEMEVRIRICVPMTNGVPDTNAMKRIGYHPHYGIVVSSPLRAKVIKE